MIKTLLLILVTIFIPPLGVLAVAGCGPDILINLLLTLLGYLPGHVHAFYIEYVYYKKRDERRAGIESAPAQGVYSKKAQTGGVKSVVGGQVVHGGNVGVAPAGGAPAAQQGYGTVV